MSNAFYDEIARIYDSMIRWEKRLEVEAPLFEALWRGRAREDKRLRVLDAACGSGMHLALIARQGLEATGADASGEMVHLAVERLASLDSAARPRIVQSRWDELAERVPETFDAVLCLGNSLPYVTEAASLEASLRGMWSRVAPGGFLLIQFKNFARMRAHGERYLPVSAKVDETNGVEHVCVRQYEWLERSVNFNIIILTRARGAMEWQLRHWTTPLATWGVDAIVRPLEALGARVTAHGSLGLEPFDARQSADVVVKAESG
jgi:SAM-dependent methyltransferase